VRKSGDNRLPNQFTGPLLDSTMALYGSGMAFGHSHGNANLPIILAGGRALGLRHGGSIARTARLAALWSGKRSRIRRRGAAAFRCV
jgi:hypothetical protein